MYVSAEISNLYYFGSASYHSPNMSSLISFWDAAVLCQDGLRLLAELRIIVVIECRELGLRCVGHRVDGRQEEVIEV